MSGATKQLDDYLSISSAIQQGKGFLASNSLISARTAECSKFTGQDQVRCVATATKEVVGNLKEMASSYGPMDWIQGRIDAIVAIGKDIINSDNKIASLAANTWFAFAQPVDEAIQAGQATASITTMSVSYAMTIAYLGLGGPVTILASILVPGLNAAWVAWVVGIFAVWFWYTSYLAGMWFLSKLLLTATASNFMSVSWFTHLSVWGAPGIAAAISGVGGLAIFNGFTKSNSDAAAVAVELVKLTAAIATGGLTGGASTVVQMSSPPSQNGRSEPPVKTAY
ncbi:MAG: hypothetical protein HC852_23475 [Acaryochloridaceae cyanobacterium RU_4_10]|nr:hypothetical protein [Acaryochloridaceae cyanobacterium RU_4_10]